MKNQAPRGSKLHQLGKLIEDIDVAMLTTVADDGSMVSRPLQTLALDADGDLVFFTAVDSCKIAQLTDTPDLNLAYADPASRRYVSVRGRARIDRDRALIDALWSPSQRVFFPGGKDDPTLVLLRVRVRDASYWESKGNFLQRAMDFTRGMLDDEPSDLGKQGHLRP